MGIFSFLGGAAGSAVGESIAKPIDAIGNVIDKLFTSDEERLDKKAIIERLKQRPAEMQVELNKLEAQHSSRYIAGWRPYIGYILGTCLGIYFIPQYLMAAVIWSKLCLSTGVMQPYPVDAASLMQLVLAMLGMGALRTYEKKKGLTK